MLFFAGAHSATEDDFVARIMQKANREAKSLGHSHRKVTFIPRGFSCVTRVEELSFPNGRIYKMKSTLVRDTEYSLMDSKCTQTDDVPARVIPLPCFQMWCFHTSFHCLDLHPGRLADPSLCVFLLCPIPSDWNSSVYKWEHLISEMLYILLTIYIVLLYSIEFILLYYYNYFMYIVYVCHKISIIIHGVCT